MSSSHRLINHPLLDHKLSFLRDKTTSSADFRQITKDIATFLTYEAMRDWNDIDEISVETPLKTTKVRRISNPPVIVTIMRAGNPFQEAALDVLPFSSAGHIGIYRDKFINNTVEYYFKLPKNVKDRPILLCDPLIATADTMIAALERLKNYEVGSIKIISLLVIQSALDRIYNFFPDVEIFSLSKEEKLTEDGYLIPGLGDAGDRLFETF